MKRAKDFKKLEIVEAYIRNVKQEVAVVGVRDCSENGEAKYELEVVTFGGSHHIIKEFEEDSRSGNFLISTGIGFPGIRYRVGDMVDIWAFDRCFQDSQIIMIEEPSYEGNLIYLVTAPGGGNYWVAENKDLDGDWFIMEKM